MMNVSKDSKIFIMQREGEGSKELLSMLNFPSREPQATGNLIYLMR